MTPAPQRRRAVSTYQDADTGAVMISVTAARAKAIATLASSLAGLVTIVVAALLFVLRPGLARIVKEETASAAAMHQQVHQHDDRERDRLAEAIEALTREVRLTREDVAEMRGELKARRP